jgi:hypothetical protein
MFTGGRNDHWNYSVLDADTKKGKPFLSVEVVLPLAVLLRGPRIQMKTTQSELEALIRHAPLLERLRLASEMIGRMAHDQRPPKMSIPVQPYDEDVFITVTLADAIEAIEGKK